MSAILACLVLGIRIFFFFFFLPLDLAFVVYYGIISKEIERRNEGSGTWAVY